MSASSAEIFISEFVMCPQPIAIGCNIKFGTLAIFKKFKRPDKLSIIFTLGMNIKFDMGEIVDIFLNFKMVIGRVKIKVHKVTDNVEVI